MKSFFSKSNERNSVSLIKNLKLKNKNSPGYTIIELLVAIGIMIILFGFITINLLSFKHSASLTATRDTLISDLRAQKLKAMTGDTEGRSSNDSYGIYFGTTSYTLFHGTAYNPSDPANFTVNLGDLIQISSVTFPSSVVIFTKGTGEISGFVNGDNTITLQDTQNNSQTSIQLNAVGVITTAN